MLAIPFPLEAKLLGWRAVSEAALFVAVSLMVVVVAVWARSAAMRREGWGELRLRYDEAPDPVVHGLNLLR